MRVTRNSLLSSYSTPSVGAFLTRRFSSASSPTRSLRSVAGAAASGDHLSHVVGDPAVVLLGMSRQIAPQTLSKALRRTKRVLDARQGMEGAKNAYRGSQEVKRADTPNQGFQVARNRASPCKAHLHGTGSHAVGRWSETVGVTAMGVWGSPQTVSGCAQGAAGTVAARSFRRTGNKNLSGLTPMQDRANAAK